MLNRFFNFLNYKNILQKNIEVDLSCHLKEIYSNKSLIDGYQKYLQYLNNKNELKQNFKTRTLLLMVSSATTLLSQLGEWYAQSKLNWIVPVCQYLEIEYEMSILHLQEISSFNSIEPAVLEIIDNYFHSRRTSLECDNNYESIRFYSEIVNNIALTISLGILIKQLNYYLSVPSPNYHNQINYYYRVLYNKIDDEITKIANEFEALSDDDKSTIQCSLNRQLSIENVIEQDATEKYFLEYFCNCKQGPIVHPVQVIIQTKVGEKITHRSELYDAYFFFGYLQTQANKQGPLRSPSGAPIVKYQFTNEINNAHHEYWVALQNEIKKLSLKKQENISPSPNGHCKNNL